MGKSFPGAIQDQDLAVEEKRLRNEGTDPARTEQASQDGDEMDENNAKIAHQRSVAGRRILRNLWRNNDSPAIPTCQWFTRKARRQFSSTLFLMSCLFGLSGPTDKSARVCPYAERFSKQKKIISCLCCGSDGRANRAIPSSGSSTYP